jgi:hypothetical protein
VRYVLYLHILRADTQGVAHSGRSADKWYNNNTPTPLKAAGLTVPVLRRQGQTNCVHATFSACLACYPHNTTGLTMLN